MSQMLQCCPGTECGGETSDLLASLANHGFKSTGSFYPERRLHSSLQAKTRLNQVPSGSKWLCKPHQKHVSQRSSAKSHEKVGSGKGSCQVLPGILQPPFPGSQAQRQMETHTRPESIEPFSQHGHFQDGNSGNNPLVLEDRGMGHFAGFQRRLLPYPYSPQIEKVSQVLPVSSDFPVYSPSIRVGHSSTRVHQGGQGSKADGASKGYQDPPVPRRLVIESPFAGDLPTTYPDPLGPMPTVRLGSKYEEVRTGPQTGIQFRRLPVRPDYRSGSTHARPVGVASTETKVHESSSPVYGSSIHVLNRPSDGHRKASLCGSSPHEAHSVAPEKALARPGSPREGYSGSTVPASSFGLVVGRGKRPQRSTPTPSSARSSSIYRRLKRRLGRTLRGLHCKRHLVSSGKSPSHKFSRTQGSPSSSETV